MIEPTVSAHPDHQFEAFRPEVRRDALVRRYGNEAVVWSPIGHAPTCLDSVATVVFQLLDGTASVADLIADIHDAVGVPESVARNQMQRVIAQLDAAGLLTTSAAVDEPHIQLDLFPAPPNP